MSELVSPYRRVTIIKTLVKQYRVTFYQKLHDELMTDGVMFRVLYSPPSRAESIKSDNVNLPNEFGRKIPSYYLLADKLLLQWPGLREIINSDLIIVVNANRNLVNLPLLLISKLGLKKVAFWGHGVNHQGSKRTIFERIKRFLVTQPDWWFAYTSETAEYITSLGFDSNCVTTINNAIDTSGFANQVKNISIEQLAAMRKRLNLTEQDRVGLYCGSLYPEKRLPFLLKTAQKIAADYPDFKLVIIGDGIEKTLIQEAAEHFDFVRYAGPLFSIEKAICYRLSEVVLNPGLVGLGILDSFAAGIPFVTLADSLHSPEIAYLEHGVNGLIIDGDEVLFAANILRILVDGSFATILRLGAEKAARYYTVENMVDNVKAGIIKCLNS